MSTGCRSYTGSAVVVGVPAGSACREIAAEAQLDGATTPLLTCTFLQSPPLLSIQPCNPSLADRSPQNSRRSVLHALDDSSRTSNVSVTSARQHEGVRSVHREILHAPQAANSSAVHLQGCYGIAGLQVQCGCKKPARTRTTRPLTHLLPPEVFDIDPITLTLQLQCNCPADQ